MTNPSAPTRRYPHLGCRATSLYTVACLIPLVVSIVVRADVIAGLTTTLTIAVVFGLGWWKDRHGRSHHAEPPATSYPERLGKWGRYALAFDIALCCAVSFALLVTAALFVAGPDKVQRSALGEATPAALVISGVTIVFSLAVVAVGRWVHERVADDLGL